MKNLITRHFATNALLIIFSLVLIFHVLVLLGIIPFGIVWGGRLKSNEEMIPFEITSILLNALMLVIVAIHADILQWNINRRVIKVALWIMVGLFFINTIGNIFSKSQMEQVIFTPLTLLLSVFSLRLAIE